MTDPAETSVRDAAPSSETVADDADSADADSLDESVRAMRVLRRGLAMSDELRRGLGVTASVALLAAAGRLIVPILVQLVLDHGVLGPNGYRPAVVWALSAGALGLLFVVMAASRAAYIRWRDLSAAPMVPSSR